MGRAQNRATTPRQKPTVVLVLQGGGALGAYHIGAYQALEEGGLAPDWFCGISMGAINAAVLAGNPPGERLGRLTGFWEAISWPEVLPGFDTGAMRAVFNNLGNAQALALGQPHFFSPRWLNPYLATPGLGATSFYDTSPLRRTLQFYADFDLINRRAVRISVGATEIETGALVFFDNTTSAARFTPEHVMASASLPPGFPPTRVDDRLYWDGGCVASTPLEAVLADLPGGHTVAFVVDLWSLAGPVPATMADVLWRAKQIQYASRTAEHIAAVAAKVRLRHALRRLGAERGEGGGEDRLDIVQVVYDPGGEPVRESYAEFSRGSIALRRAAGLADMRSVLEAEPWQRPHGPGHLGCRVHRAAGGQVVTLPEPALGFGPARPAEAKRVAAS